MKLEWWPALRAAADAGRRAVPVGAADGGRRPAACAVAVKEHSAAASMESGSRRWWALCGGGDGEQESQGWADGTTVYGSREGAWIGLKRDGVVGHGWESASRTVLNRGVLHSWSLMFSWHQDDVIYPIFPCKIKSEVHYKY